MPLTVNVISADGDFFFLEIDERTGVSVSITELVPESFGKIDVDADLHKGGTEGSPGLWELVTSAYSKGGNGSGTRQYRPAWTDWPP